MAPTSAFYTTVTSLLYSLYWRTFDEVVTFDNNVISLNVYEEVPQVSIAYCSDLNSHDLELRQLKQTKAPILLITDNTSWIVYGLYEEQYKSTPVLHTGIPSHLTTIQSYLSRKNYGKGPDLFSEHFLSAQAEADTYAALGAIFSDLTSGAPSKLRDSIASELKHRLKSYPSQQHVTAWLSQLTHPLQLK